MPWRVESIQKSRMPGWAMVSLRDLDDRDNRIATRMEACDLKRRDIRIGDTVLLPGEPYAGGRVKAMRVLMEDRTGDETLPYYMEA